MTKKKKTILLISVITIVMLTVIGCTSEKKSDSSGDNDTYPESLAWVQENMSISLNADFGENIFSVEKDDSILPYNEHYRTVIDILLEDLLTKSYSFDAPLMIYNPYGTNNLSVNAYFSTAVESEISYTISVGQDDIPDFSQVLNNDSENNYTTEHQYQIIGLVPGYQNTLSLTATAIDGMATTHTFKIDMRTVECESDTILENTEGESSVELTEGLFVLFGLDKAFNANNYIYDNHGILRGDLVISDYRSDRIEFIDGKLYYSTDIDEISVLDRLGRIEKTYSIDGYTMHHDYVYDGTNNKFLILVNSDAEEDTTIEDLIISLDLETGEVKEVIDMKDLLPDIYETAKMPESGENTYGGTGLDWIHLNSLSIVNGNGDIVISGREISTIIYLENIYENPSVKYMITDETVFDDTIYSNLVLKKNGNFVNQAGQHTITYVTDDSLADGQYYLIMYNNNYGASNTRVDFPWDSYEGVGTFAEGDCSKYYKYLVDETLGSYELIESFDVAYSSIVSSVQDVENNHITSSGKSNCYAEYNENGELIAQFKYTSKKYAYRVFKYTFNDFWFEN